VRESVSHEADTGKLWMMENDGWGIHAYENRHTEMQLRSSMHGNETKNAVSQCMHARSLS
jgi:hypothetical protein